ncbi:MAG: putative metal-dependent hydrolase [Acidobacteria bacterium]|nr:putative metal-dependent hydrolase [Acidobacteriota bacterium]
MTADLRYPVGQFDLTAPVTPEMRGPATGVIAELPRRMRAAVAGLSDARLDTPYRPGGWTVRQVVHHVADSHMNGYIRTKLALTEAAPTIKPYDQDAWTPLADSRLPIDISLGILDGVHARWAAVWRSLTPPQFERIFHHPEIGTVSLDLQLQHYAWHCHHHVAHITSLRQREGW